MITAIRSQAAFATADQAEYVLPPDVVLVTVQDGSGRLLDMGGRFHALPAIGAQMLQDTLTYGRTAAAQRLATRYGVDAQTVHHDRDGFVRELEDRGLLRDPGKRRRPATTFLARSLLLPALRWIHRGNRAPAAKAGALLALAGLSFRLFGWTRTLAVWRETHRRYEARQPEQSDEPLVRELDEAVCTAAASHLLAPQCKERGLTCWALSRAAGLAADVVVGISLFPIAGHCWCEAGRWTLSDDPDHCALYTPVIRYA